MKNRLANFGLLIQKRPRMIVETAITTVITSKTTEYLLEKGKEYLANKGLDSLWSLLTHNKNKFNTALSETISQTVEEYSKKYPIAELDKIPFYKSQTLLQELLNFRFTSEFDAQRIKQRIDEDRRIIPPSIDDLTRFLDTLTQKINQNEYLKELNLDHNYREAIFSIHSEIHSLRRDMAKAVSDIKQDISDKVTNHKLVQEYTSQLDEIEADLRQFKPLTANKRLTTLEKRFTEAQILDNTLNAKIYYLHALCLQEIKSTEINDENAKCFIKAHRYFPSNQEYKINAGLSYIAINEKANALAIADEILLIDEYNSGAWLIKCFLHEGNLIHFLKDHIPKLVFNNKSFQMQIAYWLIVQNKITDTAPLDDIGFDFSSKNTSIPDAITFSNRIYWVVWTQVQITNYFERNQLIYPQNIRRSPADREALQKIHDLLEKLASATNGTEIEKQHALHNFQLHYLKLLLYGTQESIYEMERIFPNIKHLGSIVIIQMALVLASTGIPDDIRRANSILDGFDGETNNGTQFLLQISNNVLLGDITKAQKSFRKYLKTCETINEADVFNIAQYFQNVAIKLPPSEIESELAYILNNCRFTSDALKSLLDLYVRAICNLGYDKNEMKAKLIWLQSELTTANDLTKDFIAVLFTGIGCYTEAISLIESYLNTDSFSPTYLYYCQVLHRSQTKQQILLELLKKSRLEFEPDERLLALEAQYRQLQHDWKTIIDISKTALKHYPDHQYFLYLLFAAWDHEKDSGAIAQNAYLIDQFDLSNPDTVLNIAGVLLRAGQFEKSLDLIYEGAKSRSNISLRQQYISVVNLFPKELFEDYKTIVPDCSVRYTVNSQSHVIEITSANQESAEIQPFLGKQQLETFSVGSFLEPNMSIVRIERIMNKYSALLEEIAKEMPNPALGYKAKVINGNTIEEINASFVKLIGAEGTLRKEQFNQELKRYYDGEISFSQIAHSAFNKNQFYAYEYLTSPVSQCFRTLPSAIAPTSMPISGNYVLDLTTIILFYQVSKEKGLTFPHKFYVSNNAITFIRNAITFVEVSPFSGISLDVTLSGVRPIGISKENVDLHLAFLKGIDDWVKNNCIAINVDERLEAVAKFEKEDQYNDYTNFLFDNLLLSKRQTYYLVTSDLTYIYPFGGSNQKILSPEIYFRAFFTQKEYKECLQFMASLRYIGITADSDILQEEFSNMVAGKPNNFSVCLENLSLGYNSSNTNIEEAVKFLKWLYLSHFISTDQRKRIAQAIFLHLLRGADKYRDLRSILSEVQRVFRLFGHLKDEVELELKLAIKTFRDVIQ